MAPRRVEWARLIGSVVTGHVRKSSDIDLHVFTDTVGLVAGGRRAGGGFFPLTAGWCATTIGTA